MVTVVHLGAARTAPLIELVLISPPTSKVMPDPVLAILPVARKLPFVDLGAYGSHKPYVGVGEGGIGIGIVP